MKRTIYSDFSRPPQTREVNRAPSRCDKTGYIPFAQQVRDLMMAGARLEGFRKGMYDFVAENGTIEVDEDFLDPTRRLDFDLADMTKYGEYLGRKLKAQQDAQKERNRAMVILAKQALDEPLTREEEYLLKAHFSDSEIQAKKAQGKPVPGTLELN